MQVTYLGYCASTGLETMDYRLSDPYLDPPDSDLSLYSEQTIRLPETYWCYEPGGPTPDAIAATGRGGGIHHLRLPEQFREGSAGAGPVGGDSAGVPRSRLILHSAPGTHLEEVRDDLRVKGISPDRLEFPRRQPWPDYVQTYDRIDIALDPFPYGGGITTCDALWMGVPVVTLSGRPPSDAAGQASCPTSACRN